MTEPNAGPAAGRENAQVTYDRRRARSCADTLATIPPNRWDSTTRSIIITLATMVMPSAIDPLLEAGALAIHVDIDAYERGRLALAHQVELAQPAWSPRWRDLPDGTEDIREAFAAELDRLELTPEEADDERERDEQAAADDATCRRQHNHGTAELAAACDALEGPFTPVAGTVPRPEPRPYPDPRPRPDPDPRPRPEPHPEPRPRGLVKVGHFGPCQPGCVHDNGDYRA
jgi:hypothetical protein